MNFWGKEKKTGAVLHPFNEFQDTLKEFEIKTGPVKVFSVRRNAKGKPAKYLNDTRPVRDFRDGTVEDILAADYGGGEFELQVYKEENGINRYVRTLHYQIAGENQDGDDLSDDPLKALAYKSLEKQLNTNPSNITEQLLLRMIDANANSGSGRQNSLLDQVQILKEIGELTKSQIPVIPPENETAAMMQMISTLAATYMASKMNAPQPTITPVNVTPALAEIKLPSGGNGSHGPNEEQPKPIETTISYQDAFYKIFLEQFKLAGQEGSEIDEFAGMIESMAVNCIGWIPEPQWHPVVVDFVKGYSKMDLGLLNTGFERLMTFAEVDKETADKIKARLLTIYQNNVTQMKAEGMDAGEQG
jgi:hypothetical protein